MAVIRKQKRRFLFKCLALLMALMLSACTSTDMVEVIKEYAHGVGQGEDQFTGCWFCPAFGVAFDTINRLATNVVTKLGGLFLTFLGLGMLFFLVFKIARSLIKLQEVNLMQFLEELFRPLGRMMIAAVLLTVPLGIFYYLISPMTQLGFTLADQIYAEAGVGEMSIVRVARDKANTNLTVQCEAKTKSTETFEWNKAFDPMVRQSLLCNLQQVSNSLLLGVAASDLMIRAGLQANCIKIPLIMDVCFPSFSMIITGVIFCIAYLGLLLYYPTKLLDALCRLAFVSALMPLWIILWAFPATAGYAKKAWDLFLAFILYFIALSIVMAIILLIFDKISFPDEYWELGFAGKWAKANETLPKGFLMPLIAIIVSIFSFVLLGKAQTLSNTFVGATDLGVNNAATKSMTQAVATAGIAAKTLGRAADGAVMAGTKNMISPTAQHLISAGKKARAFEQGKENGLPAAPRGRFGGSAGATVPPPAPAVAPAAMNSASKTGPTHPPVVHGTVSHVNQEGVSATFVNSKGQTQTNVFGENGLKEQQVVTSSFANGSPKTAEIRSGSGKLIGTRFFDERALGNWTQQNADGSTTTHTVTKNKDGSVESITDTRDKNGNAGTYVRQKNTTFKDEKGLDKTRRETWTTDRKTGAQQKRTEIGKTDQKGRFRVLEQTDESYQIAQGKQEKGTVLKVKTTSTFAYDEQGNLQVRHTRDADDRLLNTRYYTDSGVKADGSYTFGYRDYTYKDNKPVETGKSVLYHVNGRRY